MARRLRSWLGLPSAERRRTLEAAILLTAALGAVRMLSFSAYSRWMGRPGPAAGEAPGPPGGGNDGVGTARDVSRALRRAVRHLPWTSTCLMRAVAGQIMLRRRRCGGTVYVGVERTENSGGADHHFHAWLLAGGVPITGVHEAPRFTVVATFR